MAHLVKDTTGEIQEGSIYLPRSKKVLIGQPVVGVAIADLKQELSEVYGDRFEVTEQDQAAEPEPQATPTTEARPPTRRKPAGGEVNGGEG